MYLASIIKVILDLNNYSVYYKYATVIFSVICLYTEISYNLLFLSEGNPTQIPNE
jgi:hypothetical protein